MTISKINLEIPRIYGILKIFFPFPRKFKIRGIERSMFANVLFERKLVHNFAS